jgi:ssDNA-binding Zn-finger/Zn-ribbon topoisomerase 1
MSNKLLGILSLILGIKVIFVKKWTGNWIDYDFSNNYLYLILGTLCMYVGILFLKHKEIKQTEYSKCPKCKTAYDYQKLDKGMCPKCHVKTIEMEEYFKQFPKELKKK